MIIGVLYASGFAKTIKGGVGGYNIKGVKDKISSLITLL